MGWQRMAAVHACVLGLLGCGFDGGGLEPASDEPAAQDGGANGSEAGLTTEAAPGEGAAPDAAPPSCNAPAGACTASVPPGWKLVAFAPMSAACPSGWEGQALVSNPQAQPGACDCSCNVTTHPSCELGTLQRWVSNDNSCSTQGAQFAVNGAGCTQLSVAAPISPYGQASPLPPAGGACDAKPVLHASMVGSTRAQSCTPPAACQEQLCKGEAPAGFGACLVGAAGAKSCPSGWGTPVAVGDATTLACSACACDVNGASTCTGAALTYYGATDCTSELARVAIDGTCGYDPGNGQTTYAFSYDATLTETCAATGPKTATVGLTNARTICCKP